MPLYHTLLGILTDWDYSDTFPEYPLIFVPTCKSTPASWRYPNECLWDAPSDFTSKVPLKEIYSSSFENLGVGLDHLAGFFRETLKIPDIDCDDVLNELEDLKLQPSVKGEVIRHLYGILFVKLPAQEDKSQKIR